MSTTSTNTTQSQGADPETGSSSVVSELEKRLYESLNTNSFQEISELAGVLGADQSQVAALGVLGHQQGFIQIEETVLKMFRLGKKAGSGLPDRKIAQALADLGGSADMPACAERAGLESKEVGQALRWLKLKAWAEQEGKSLKLTEAGRQALISEQPLGADEQLLTILADGSEKSESDLSTIDLKVATELLEGRSGYLDLRERTRRSLRLTASGAQRVQAGLVVKTQVTALTHEMMLSGAWKDAEFRSYDVQLKSEDVYPAKMHPLVNVFQQTRRVFLELGFSETVSSYVESSFWDFDALFQPQDHPARDMQDTFYVARPASCQLPDRTTVDRVRQTHETGGDTGSVGWRYRWNEEMTKRPVLRTHTTASTIRALAADPTAPRKVFCVGPVFRRETVDYKHLPVFHQVDGIIVDEKGSFASLLGTLKAFYSKMGFQKFQFRPAFFPYTEPSVEIFVWSDKKNDWVEMGGAGMFRPEVTEPLGCKSPVLAWGLGLERLAMFRYELSSIGELYRARLGWLKETSLCL
jgi:phenylalanyl-tRNA synthetase alpha chain